MSDDQNEPKHHATAIVSLLLNGRFEVEHYGIGIRAQLMKPPRMAKVTTVIALEEDARTVFEDEANADHLELLATYNMVSEVARVLEIQLEKRGLLRVNRVDTTGAQLS